MLQPHVFYVLCKGDNAGKPGLNPWANSFAVVCNNQQNFNFYFWLMYALWKDGRFKTFHHGTAIQFINLQDVRDLLSEVAPAIQPNWQKYQQILESLSKLEQKKVGLLQQVVSTETMQRQLLKMYLS